MSENTFDLVIIGSGPGGYVAAIRGAQLGLKTALVEKSKTLGGTCLNVGCIPSKALLHSTEMYHFARHGAAAHGIDLTNLSISIEQLMAKKDKTVAQLCGGIQHLMKANKIKVFNGQGILDGDSKVRVRATGEDTVLTGKHIIIATGSASIELPFLKYDGETVVSSTEAIAFDSVPEKLAVVGAGAIGLELGSVWARLGAEVNVIEFLPVIAPSYDKDVSKMAERLLKKQGLNFHLKTKVTGLKKSKGKQILTAEKAGNAIEFEVDKVLVAVGRKPYTEGLGLETVGITTDDKGRIPVDTDYKTSATGVYAIGDVIPGPMLAHKAKKKPSPVLSASPGKQVTSTMTSFPTSFIPIPKSPVSVSARPMRKHRATQPKLVNSTLQVMDVQLLVMQPTALPRSSPTKRPTVFSAFSYRQKRFRAHRFSSGAHGIRRQRRRSGPHRARASNNL